MPKDSCSTKKKWKGLFSYRCELEVQYVYAYTKEQAKALLFRRLSNKHDVSYGAVASIFDGSKDNYIIEEVTE